MSKARKYIVSILGIYLIIGLSALIYLVWNPVDKTSLLVANASVIDTDVSEKVIEPTSSKTADTLPTDAPASSGNAEEEPLFIDIKGNPVYLSKSYNYMACHTRGNLFIRTAPSMSGKIIGRLAPGDTDVVLTIDQEWSYVSYKNHSGYIYNQYLSFLEQTPNSSVDEGVDEAVNESIDEAANSFTVKSDVTLRNKANKNGDSLGVLKTGQMGTILQYDVNWCYVQCETLTGYVSTSYLLIN